MIKFKCALHSFLYIPTSFLDIDEECKYAHYYRDLVDLIHQIEKNVETRILKNIKRVESNHGNIQTSFEVNKAKQEQSNGMNNLAIPDDLFVTSFQYSTGNYDTVPRLVFVEKGTA